MRTLVLTLVTLLMVSLLLTGCGGGSDSGGGNRSDVVGQVVLIKADTGPVGQGGIIVTLVNGTTTFSATSDSLGNFTIQDVPVGTYSVQVTVPPVLDFVLQPGHVIPVVHVLSNEPTLTIPDIPIMDKEDVPPDPA